MALIDIGLPVRTGLDVLAEIQTRDIAVKTIVLTGDTCTYTPEQIYAAGADGFLYKTTDAARFLQTFLDVAIGKSPAFVQKTGAPKNASNAELRDTLTSREMQIVKLVVEGRNNKAVAKTLFISEHTVRKHREHINKKLDIHSPTNLAAFAIKTGIV